MVRLRKMLILSHRYLGIVVSFMFLMWFVTGIGMIYSRGMPRLTPQLRLSRLSPVDLSTVKFSPAEAAERGNLGDLDALESPVTLVTVGERPAYRFGGTTTVFADTGEYMIPIESAEAEKLAARYMGVPEGKAHFLDEVKAPDQWTLTLVVRQLPLYKIRVEDEAQTILYVSPDSAEVVQLTTRAGRALSWVSTIPHFLYFTALRTSSAWWLRAMTSFRLRLPAGFSMLTNRIIMKSAIWICLVTLGITVTGLAAAQGRGGQAASPASRPPPRTTTPQTYTPELVRAGEVRFVSQCASCHGRDTAGGETGPDLTRSTLVASDVRGDKIGPLLSAGRPDKGMPAFTLKDQDLADLVAYVHAQKTIAESLGGGRRSVDAADLRTGNADAGRQYFNGAGNCAKCHSATGDLAGVGARTQGLALLQRMLNPPRTRPAKVTVTLPTGEIVAGTLVSRDEFTITISAGGGDTRVSGSPSDLKATIDDPLSAHFDQLGKYTDGDMHNVFAFLETLR